MQIRFEADPHLPADQIEVILRAAQRTPQVQAIEQALTTTNLPGLPVKLADQIMLIKLAELVKIEVDDEELSYSLVDRVIKTTGHLNRVIPKLDQRFVQVSRSCVLNLDHLQSLENSWGSGMVARLTGGQKAAVSRRFVKVICERLGI